ncbi:MAG: hypothetical protein E6J08_14045, partial [Chloroflexi bacterium]
APGPRVLAVDTTAAPARQADWAGTAMVLGSAVAFGTLSIFAKLAYSAGLGTEQLLAFRFVLAAIGMWVLSFAVGQSPMRLPRRHAAGLLALGGVLYPAQALTYFYALRTLPASLCVLLVYIYPSLVVIAGWLFLRRRISIWHGAALALSFVGVGMLVGGAQFQLASGLIFALLCVVAGVEGRLGLPHTTGAWAVSVGIAVVPTMVAISLFLAGLPRIGAARAALLSTLEPVVTVSLAIAILGDRFSILQALGGVLVLLAVVVVQAAHLWRAGPPSALR